MFSGCELRAFSAELHQGKLWIENAALSFDEDFGTGRTTKDGRFGTQPIGDLGFPIELSCPQSEQVSDQPLGVCAQHAPKLVLFEMPVGDQGCSRVSAKGWQPFRELRSRIGVQVPSLCEKRNQ